MTDNDNSPFIYNVFFIGQEGFREHFKVAADTSEDLAVRRKAVLGLLKEWGAISDVRGGPFSETAPKAAPSAKLAKFGPKQAEDGVGEAVTPMEQAAKDSIAAPDAPEKTPAAKTKFVRQTKPSPDEVPAADAKPTEALKPSRLAKYAKPEKE